MRNTERGGKALFGIAKLFHEVIVVGYILTCDDGEFYFDDIDEAMEYGEQHCPHGYNIDEVFD